MNWENADDLNACARIVEKGDPARFRTVMAAPLSARAKLFPLYAFNVEVSRAPWVTSEPMIAQMRLQWWRDALEEIAAGGDVRRHEVVTPLMHVLGRGDVHVLDEICVARYWDCCNDPFDTQIDLEQYLRRTSGNLMQVACSVLGNFCPAAAPVGYALGVANWLQAIPALEAQKRIPMVDGTLEGVVKLAGAGLQALNEGAKLPIPKSLAPAFWPALGARRVLRAAQKHPHLVGQGSLPSPSRLSLPLAALFGNARL